MAKKLKMPDKKKTRRDLLQEQTDEILWFADGFDDAIVGIDMSGPRVVYDYEECIQCLMDEGLSEMDAYDTFHFNTLGTYIGEETAIFVYFLKEEEDE